MNPPLDKFGHFQLIEELGRGGMGIVYKAFDPAAERHVALKVLLGLTQCEELERFQREIAATAQLAHPAIVRIHSSGVSEGGRPFQVLEFLEGQALDKSTAQEKRPLSQVIEVMTKIARAVDFAHSKGFIHRDIKPGNIFLCQSGDAKLLDFGIAKSLSDAKGQSLTQSGVFLGSLPYMAPEQLQNDAASPSMDIYALGATLYFLLTGRPPFDPSLSPVRLALDIEEKTPQAPHLLNPDVPRALSDLCLKALSKKAKDRFQSAATFAKALESAPTKPEAPTPIKPAMMKTLFAALLVLGLALGISWVLSPGTPKLAEVTFQCDDPIALSKDGQIIAQLSSGQTFTTSLPLGPHNFQASHQGISAAIPFNLTSTEPFTKKIEISHEVRFEADKPGRYQLLDRAGGPFFLPQTGSSEIPVPSTLTLPMGRYSIQSKRAQFSSGGFVPFTVKSQSPNVVVIDSRAPVNLPLSQIRSEPLFVDLNGDQFLDIVLTGKDREKPLGSKNDGRLLAISGKTGQVLWRSRSIVSVNATPRWQQSKSRQFIVIGVVLTKKRWPALAWIDKDSGATVRTVRLPGVEGPCVEAPFRLSSRDIEKGGRWGWSVALHNQRKGQDRDFLFYHLSRRGNIEHSTPLNILALKGASLSPVILPVMQANKAPIQYVGRLDNSVFSYTFDRSRTDPNRWLRGIHDGLPLSVTFVRSPDKINEVLEFTRFDQFKKPLSYLRMRNLVTGIELWSSSINYRRKTDILWGGFIRIRQEKLHSVLVLSRPAPNVTMLRVLNQRGRERKKWELAMELTQAHLVTLKGQRFLFAFELATKTARLFSLDSFKETLRKPIDSPNPRFFPVDIDGDGSDEILVIDSKGRASLKPLSLQQD